MESIYSVFIVGLGCGFIIDLLLEFFKTKGRSKKIKTGLRKL